MVIPGAIMGIPVAGPIIGAAPAIPIAPIIERSIIIVLDIATLLLLLCGSPGRSRRVNAAFKTSIIVDCSSHILMPGRNSQRLLMVPFVAKEELLSILH